MLWDCDDDEVCRCPSCNPQLSRRRYRKLRHYPPQAASLLSSRAAERSEPAASALRAGYAAAAARTVAE
jgi:hypothetical protein